MVAFYNQADQDIYNSGSKFVPQERYRLDYKPPVTAPPVASGGITNTNAFTNSGGNDFSVYNPDPNSIVNRNYNPYLFRNAAENSFLPGRSNATDPRYLNEPYNPGIKSAQQAYNQANEALAQGVDPNSQGFSSFTGGTLRGLKDIANNMVMDNRQNYGAQGQFETVDSPLAYNSETELNKFKDNYPEYFAPKPLEGIPGMIQKYAQNNMFSKALGFAENMLPTNRRGILENELSGQGVMVNNIGQIVQGQGDYDTAGNVMAGYNANKLTAESFDKRISMAEKNMSDKNKGARITALKEAKVAWEKATGKSTSIYDFEEEEKKKNKKNTVINRFITKKKETKTAKEKAAQAAATGGSYTASGGVTDSNYNQAANIAGGGGGDSARNSQGQTAREATYDGNKNTGTSQGYSQHYARGGRAGYFFGGRVNYKAGGRVSFKNGGLASIL